MKVVIVAAFVTVLAGCAGTSGYSNDSTGSGSSSRPGDPLERDPVFNSWIS
ncbi:hypothetical protein GCM10027343_21720 [Noviherbaspirillum agri]